MSKLYKSKANIGACAAGEVYEHTWTERTPNGDSGLRDSKGYDMRIKSTLLHDPRYFEEIVPPANKFDGATTIGVSETAYHIGGYCSNCDWQGNLSIPKGKMVSGVGCPNCGCATVHARKEPRL